MTDIKLLDKFMHRIHAESANENNAESESEIDDLGVFGFLRGSRERATMLELRKRDGHVLAVGYGMFEVEFNPSEGIALHFADRKITIKGCNLNAEAKPNIKLFEAICRHRVPWLREASEPERLSACDGETLIEAIEW
ncbi:hypothetical protein RAS2_16440 [Phycisphaerae bacterium RAS2]|nr:hypothetical protein RAS2_16440 [Phycisphaerae bacterium RAS2]